MSAVGIEVPPDSPEPGQCWIVGANPGGAWSGRANALAGWTDGGWRFVAPMTGMTAWTGGDAGFVRWDGDAWVAGLLTGSVLSLGGHQVVGPRASAIPDPAGGATVDSHARDTLTAILTALRDHGLIANT